MVRFSGRVWVRLTHRLRVTSRVRVRVRVRVWVWVWVRVRQAYLDPCHRDICLKFPHFKRVSQLTKQMISEINKKINK